MQWSMKIDMALPQPIRVVFRGVGQVFFCGNAVTGLIFLIALYVGGITAGLAATVGVLTSTITAYFMGFPEDEIDAGLYGYNGTLVGPCLFLFLENTPQLWLYVVLGSILSSIVMAALLRILEPYKVSPSTSPFVLSSWMLLAAVFSFQGLERAPALPIPEIPSAVVGAGMLAPDMWFTALSKGVAEVMFADSIIVGILFIIGIAITSIRGAFMGICGTIIGTTTALILGGNLNMIEMGMYAFNPVLATMAVGWVCLKPTWKSTALAILAGIMTVICHAALATFLTPIGLPVLTFPFVLVMWMFVYAAARSKYWS